MKTYEEKAIPTVNTSNYISLVWASIHCQDLQAWGKWWQSSPVLQLTKSTSKKQKETDTWIEKDSFKSGSRLNWKIVEIF